MTEPPINPAYLDTCGVPLRHRDATVEHVAPWSEWFETAQVAMGFGSIVVLVGTRGSGKTQIGVELIREALRSKRSPAPRFTHVMDIFLTIRSGYATKADERENVQRYIKPSLLVIDECQDRGETEFEDRMLRYIVDQRYNAMVDTVLVSNLKRDAFIDAMGKSVSSRIAECGKFITCEKVNWRTGA